MTADIELLPCPFCGKTNQDRWPCEWIDGSGGPVIRCAWCHGAAPLNVWNRRTAPPSAPVGVVGGLLERLDAIHRQVFGKPYPTEALAQQPSVAPVGVEVASLPALWRQREDNGEERTEFDKGYEQASDECAEALERTLAQQPAAVDGAMAGWIADGDTIPAALIGAARDAIRREFGISGTDGYYKRILVRVFHALAAKQSAAVDEVEQLTEQQAVIVTGYTGTLCGSFGAFHADLEKRAGRSVFTHEMSDFGWIKSLYRDDFIALAGQHGGPHDDR